MNKPMRERSTGPSASERLRRVLEAFDRVLAQEEPLPEHLIPLAQGLYSWRTLDAELLELLVDSSSSAAITMRDDGGHPFMVFGHGERGVHFEYTRHHGENYFDLMGTVIGAGVCQVRIEQPPEVLVTEANEVGEFQLSGLVPGTARITIRLTDDVLMVTPWFVFPDLAEH